MQPCKSPLACGCVTKKKSAHLWRRPRRARRIRGSEPLAEGVVRAGRVGRERGAAVERKQEQPQCGEEEGGDLCGRGRGGPPSSIQNRYAASRKMILMSREQKSRTNRQAGALFRWGIYQSSHEESQHLYRPQVLGGTARLLESICITSNAVNPKKNAHK